MSFKFHTIRNIKDVEDVHRNTDLMEQINKYGHNQRLKVIKCQNGESAETWTC